MKFHVEAKASEFKFATWREADDCIEKHKKYGVKCEMQRNLGFLNNTYDLFAQYFKIIQTRIYKKLYIFLKYV